MSNQRHLSTHALLEHWSKHVPVLLVLAGTPRLQLRLDPQAGRVALRIPLQQPVVPPPNTMTHVRVDCVQDADGPALEIATLDDRLLLDGYAMLSAVADRVQVDGMEPLAALSETLGLWRSILATRVRMSLMAEIGLFGELLVLEALLNAGTASVGAWRGWQGEEHDFGLADLDLEVKTTSGERRVHWINGLGQLVETPGRQLWLLSVQITRAGSGPGRTLATLIDDLTALVPSTDGEIFNTGLQRTGWADDSRDLFTERWASRSQPAGYRVTGAFPRLTPSAVASLDLEPGIRAATYELDLTDRAPDAPVPVALLPLTQHIFEQGST